ncbi:ROK family transcriptional regulator [Brevibacillus brevis]|uniref:ROK family transcriptional regulator n=1 Tax=Brevibacillus brevis TaxID=1393 RepID=A0ABY9T3Z2_BREBE|nr:ROK family transcriptional regulator [Brevibacillus brevis]WNC14798.1 ROK family transcriptional regulator [Brevibacillus brevis]
MIQTGDQFLVKKINKSIVLETIKKKSPISRIQISETTGLNKSTVSSLVNELIQENFVYEIGLGQSQGGRRPLMLLFNNTAGYAIGIDIGVNYLLAVLSDLKGNIIHETMLTITDLPFEEIVDFLKKTIQSLIDQAPSSNYGIIGIGIAVPGIVDDTGKILFAPNLGWENVDLKGIIENHFRLPVTINNEAKAGAFGEKIFGAGKDVSHFVYVSVGIGIGTGIIINNELYKGYNGFSGEMGHITIEANGKKCLCGNRGCWELYASENALLEQAKTLSIPPAPDEKEVTLSHLVMLADTGNTDVIQLFNQVGEYIGLGLTTIINTFNPELIVIGNKLTSAEKWLMNPIKRVVESRSMRFHRKQLRIQFSNLNMYSTVLGTISFAIDDFFASTRITL